MAKIPADSGVPSPAGVRLSLKWKAFLLLLLLLGAVHTFFGILGARNLDQMSRQQAELEMERSRATLHALLDQSAESQGYLARLVAVSIQPESAGRGAQPPALLESDLLFELDSVEIHDASRQLAAWSLAESPDTDDGHDRREIVAQVFEQRQPAWRLNCDATCVQRVYVPALDRGGRDLVVMIARTMDGLLRNFERQTATGLAILVADPEDAVDPSSAKVWGHPVRSVTNAETMLPILRQIDRSMPDLIDHSRPQPVSAGGSHYLLSLESVGSQTEGRPIELLLVHDRTDVVARIAAERRSLLLSAGLGMVLSVVAVLLMLTLAMRRLERVTAALPLLAEKRFGPARELMKRRGGSGRFADEVESLRETSLQLADRLEQLYSVEAVSEAKSRFLAAMSHEIRTPMNGILGLLELHEATPLSNEQRESVRTIRDSALTLLAVIDDILDYSKLEAGRVELDQVTFSLRDLVEGVLRTLASTAGAARLRLIPFVDPALPARVTGDPGRLRQVLFNLCGNAIKFTPRGRVIVRVVPDPSPPQSDGRMQVNFSIEDTGIGIPADQHERLFQPFSQADASTTRRFGGSGLGLVISKGLVERMGGSVSFTSTEGQGSTFRFSVPFRQSEPASPDVPKPKPLREIAVELKLSDSDEQGLLSRYLESAGARVDAAGAIVPRVVIRDDPEHWSLRLTREPADARFVAQTLDRPVGYAALGRAVATLCGRDAAPAGHVEGPTVQPLRGVSDMPVLVAEDHPTNRLVIGEQLRRLGCAVEFATNGREALERLSQGRFALLLTDVHMPDLDGIQLTEELRRQELAGERAGRLPVVALSADVLPESVERFRRAGMDDFIAKPASLNALKDALERWLPVLPASKSVIVDESVLTSLIGDNPDLRRDVLNDFVRVNRDNIRRLEEAVRLFDAENTRLLAHRLKGSARTIGAVDLAARSSELEAAGTAGEDHQFNSLFARVRSEFERVSVFIANRGAPGESGD